VWSLIWRAPKPHLAIVVEDPDGREEETEAETDLRTELGLKTEPVVSVTEGRPLRALEGLEGEDRGSARLVALEGDNQGRRLWRILASRGIIEARNTQTRPFSLLSAFFCDYRPPRCRQRWIPIRTPIVVYPLLSRDVNRMRARLQQYENSSCTREESPCGGHH
jgi:hypothetical protein